jgi:hypothetical protein
LRYGQFIGLLIGSTYVSSVPYKNRLFPYPILGHVVSLHVLLPWAVLSPLTTSTAENLDSAEERALPLPRTQPLLQLRSKMSADVRRQHKAAIAESDERLLAELGYKQEFQRAFRPLEVFSSFFLP